MKPLQLPLLSHKQLHILLANPKSTRAHAQVAVVEHLTRLTVIIIRTVGGLFPVHHVFRNTRAACVGLGASQSEYYIHASNTDK